MNVAVVIPVFRDPSRALCATASLLDLPLPSQAVLQVIIVDDGSGDATPDIIEAGLPASGRLLRLDRNVGRSGARNAGAAAARGDLLLFMDCDCVPADERFISSHVDRLEAGAVASTGPVVGAGEGFWHDFQVLSSQRRAALHSQGVTCAGSTPNLMVRRDSFLEIGGFDQRYRTYGFEDRDLLIRLSKIGEIAWTPNAVVEHHDDLDLRTVCGKMREAGGEASAIFSARHHEAYRSLGYARLDSRVHPGWRPVRPLLDVGLPPAIGAVSRILEWKWLPFRFRAGLVRTLSGLSFLRGTMDTPAA